MGRKKGGGKTHKCLKCNNLTPLYKIYCSRKCYNDDHNKILVCPECKREKRVPLNWKSIYCSIKCSSKHTDYKEVTKKRKQTIVERYGVEHQSQIEEVKKSKKLKRENGSHINAVEKQKIALANRSEEEKIKTSKKMSESHKNKSDEEKQLSQYKKEQTCLKRYGIKNVLCKDSKYRKQYNNVQRKLNLKNILSLLKEIDIEIMEEYKGVRDTKGDNIYYKFKHTPTQTVFIDHLACGNIPSFKDFNENIGVSGSEKELSQYIKELLPDKEIILNNKKTIRGYEIDIYIPELKLAIEYNGIYWHSEISGGKDKNYHLNKTQECISQDIHLIHIFEDEWRFKKDIVKHRLKHILGVDSSKIYARKCEIKEIDNNVKNDFLNIYHIQGTDKSKIKLGLYYNNELVAVMTFGNLRRVTGLRSKENEYELIRFASKRNVIGGASKLFKYFTRAYSPTKIISYADRRWSFKGEMYLKLGFKFTSYGEPNYWYMKHYKYREHRFKYRKSELSKLLKNFDPQLSEWKNMQNNKYDRIWDCGSYKFEWVES